MSPTCSASWVLTMLGWSSRPPASISWRKRSRPSGWARAAPPRTLIATTRPSQVWLAFQTVPMPPSPSLPSSSYLPDEASSGGGPSGPGGADGEVWPDGKRVPPCGRRGTRPWHSGQRSRWAATRPAAPAGSFPSP